MSAKPHLARPVQIWLPCPIYCCSIHLARHARASSWHAVQIALTLALLQASSWLCCSAIRISWLNAVHQASIWLNITASCIHNVTQCYASMTQCYQTSICISMLWIRLKYSCASCINNILGAQWSVSCINNASVWLTNLHLCTMAQCCASGINMAQCCASGINVAVHHASIIMSRCCTSTAYQASVWSGAHNTKEHSSSIV